MLSSDATASPFGWMSRGACQSQDPELFLSVTTRGAALLHQVNTPKNAVPCATRKP
jgi:hypothetical protein